MLKLAVLAAGAAALAAPAFAEGATVRLEHLAARVTIIPEARANITAEVTAGKTMARPQLHVSGAELTVEGDMPNARLHNCRVSEHGKSLNFGFWSRTRAEDLPQVTLHVPQDVTIVANGAIIGDIGSLHSLRLRQERCGGWHVGDVSDRFSLELQGLGDIDAGAVGDAEVDAQGLGDIRIRSTKGLKVRLDGMGDVRVDEVSGPVTAALAGLGDLKIKGGHATSFNATLDGMGDITFGGTADTVDASADGMGSIRIAHATGDVHKNASGFSHITVGK